MITTRYREKWTDSDDRTDEWLAPYIDVPSHKRTAIADRIEDTAMLPWVIDAGVSYPSDAMAQALTGEFTAKAWARFKTATDIYCERNRLKPKVDAWGRTGPRISWSFDIHYPTCYYDVTGLASIWTCTSARCSEVSARDSIYSKYTTCPERRQNSWVWSCNPFNWHETPTLPKNYERINYDRWGAYDATLEYLGAYIDEHESWETTPRLCSAKEDFRSDYIVRMFCCRHA